MNIDDKIILTITDKKIMYDNSAKLLLSEHQVLSRIIKYTVKEAKGFSLDEIEKCICAVYIESNPVEPHFQIKNNENMILNEGTIYYDVIFSIVLNNEQIEVKLYIDLELQNHPKPGYHLLPRGIVYSSRMISSQYDKEYNGKNYGGLKKCILYGL